MLDSSSSEDTGGESDLEPQRKPDASSSAEKRETGPPGSQQLRSATPGSLAGKSTKVNSATDEEQEKRKRESIQKEEEERKIKLQIYVFVLRCIAYPFNAKQPTDMSRRQQKVSYCCTPVVCLLCKNQSTTGNVLTGSIWSYQSKKSTQTRKLCIVFVITRTNRSIRFIFNPQLIVNFN